MSLDSEQSVYFRDQFRAARAAALQDAEGFQEILFTLERLGVYLLKKQKDLGKYEDEITKVANKSPLANPPKKWQGYHSQFSSLYASVRLGRNDALHQGAIARSLTEHAIQIALIIEDALMADENLVLVSDYMIRGVTCASLWQPLSFARQIMLTSSFSYLPMWSTEKNDWQLLSDTSIAIYLLKKTTNRRAALAKSIAEAVSEGLELEIAQTTMCHTTIGEGIEKISDFNGKPLLVVENLDDKKDRLLGIVTGFDLL